MVQRAGAQALHVGAGVLSDPATHGPQTLPGVAPKQNINMKNVLAYPYLDQKYVIV